MVALLRELDFPPGIFTQLKVGGVQNVHGAELFVAGSGLWAVARRAGVPRLWRAFCGRLHMEVSAEACASGTGAQQRRQSRALKEIARDSEQSSRRNSRAREGPRLGASPIHRRARSLGRKGADTLATLVHNRITMAELRRAVDTPIVID